MMLTPAPPCTLPPPGWRCLLADGHGGTSCPTVRDDVDYFTRQPLDPTDPDNGVDEAIDRAACWLGRAIWAGIIAGGFTLGGGLVAGVIWWRSR